MRTPIVSIVLPNHDCGHFLSECLDSVLAQTFDKWEVIIVDDTSADDSRRVARSYVHRLPEKVRLIRLHDGPGVAARAVNVGIRAMRGQYFSWLNAGDRWRPKRLEAMVRAMEDRPAAGMIHSAYRHIDQAGAPQAVTVPETCTGERAFFRLLEGNFISAGTVLVRRELLDAIGPLLETDDDLPDLGMVSDYLLWLEIAMRSEVALLEEPLHDLRVHDLKSDIHSAGYRTQLARIGKRHFVKKHGLPKVVSWLSNRARCSRVSVYGELTTILIRDAFAEDVAILFASLREEAGGVADEVEEAIRRFQGEQNERLVLDHYLNRSGPMPKAVLRAFKKPTPDVEALILRQLRRAKELFIEGQVGQASTELRFLLGASHLFPSLDLSARFYLAISLETLGDRDAAVAQFEAVLRREPGHRKALAALERLERDEAPALFGDR